jgi:hypothetical protein
MADIVKSNTTAVAELDRQSGAVREYFRSGNVAGLNDAEKDFVLRKLCERYNLDVILRPFELIEFQGKQKFYMTASATNQLAGLRNLTREVQAIKCDFERGIAECQCTVTDSATGRKETGSGFISITRFEVDKTKPGGVAKVSMSGEDLANALAKLETKAKRRVTLAFFGVPDAGLDEDMGTPIASPELVRIEGTSDTDAAKEIARTSAPASAKPAKVATVIDTPAAAPQKEEAPATETAPETPRRRGRPAKAAEKATVETPTTEERDDLEAQISGAAPQGKPTEEIKTVIYKRAEHAKFLLAAADKIFGGDPAWKNDDRKNKIVAAIPALDGKVAVVAEGSTEILPEFLAALKKAAGV